MAATDEMVAIALDIKPDYVTLVPERREEVTTEVGHTIISRAVLVGLERAVREMKQAIRGEL
jgi:pyridoxine 5-phosphate synthase